MIDKKYRDTEFPVLDKIAWYCWESSKTIVANSVAWVCFEAILLIVTMTDDPTEIAAFSLLNAIPSIMAYVIMGGVIEPKTWINHYLRQNNFAKVRRSYWLYSFVFLAVGVFTCVPIYLFCFQVYKQIGATPEVLDWI